MGVGWAFKKKSRVFTHVFVWTEQEACVNACVKAHKQARVSDTAGSYGVSGVEAANVDEGYGSTSNTNSGRITCQIHRRYAATSNTNSGRNAIDGKGHSSAA